MTNSGDITVACPGGLLLNTLIVAILVTSIEAPIGGLGKGEGSR